MAKDVLNESMVRTVVKILLEDKTLGPAMVKVNPVVDPSAAITDPSNSDFKPATKPELKVALSAIISDVSDDSIPSVYDSIKHALDTHEDDKGDHQMKNVKTEQIVRNMIRQIIQENVLSEAEPPRPRPKFVPPTQPLKTDDDAKFDTTGMSAAEKKQMAAAKKWASTAVADEKARQEFLAKKGVTKVEPGASGTPALQKPSKEELSALRRGLEASSLGSEEEKSAGGKKNVMVSDTGGEGLKELAAEFGFKNPNGVLQWINKVLQNVQQRVMNPEAYEIATLEALNDYINRMVETNLITSDDAKLMKQYPNLVGEVGEDPDDEGSFFRTRFLAPRLKKLDKMFKGKSGG